VSEGKIKPRISNVDGEREGGGGSRRFYSPRKQRIYGNCESMKKG